LVNLILNREAVKEFLQQQCSSNNIRKELDRILNDTGYKKQILDSYEELHQKLGGPGASERAAKLMYRKLKGTK
jgi:lipid-A-disaccharide synthase